MAARKRPQLKIRVRKYTLQILRMHQSTVFGRVVREAWRSRGFTALNDEQARLQVAEQWQHAAGGYGRSVHALNPIVIKRGHASPTGIVAYWSCLEAVPGGPVLVKELKALNHRNDVAWRYRVRG